MRRLKRRPPVSDSFGVTGREWLQGPEVPIDESETLQGTQAVVNEQQIVVAAEVSTAAGDFAPATDDRGGAGGARAGGRD